MEPSKFQGVLGSAQHMPYLVPEGKRVWHIESKGLDLTLGKGQSYKLVNAAKNDFAKIRELYLRAPVAGYDVASVQIIHNPTLSANFQSRVEVLQQRAGNPAFQAKWVDEPSGLEARKEVYRQLKEITQENPDVVFPSVKFLPMWHGTQENLIESISKTGFANLALTDSGYFGKGIYSTNEAEYAWRVYSKSNGVLLLIWNACFSAYPVIDGDMKNLKGKGNFANHDAHFIPVVPEDPAKVNEVSYIPCKKGQKRRYIELVVFEQSQCFPRVVVRLQSNLKQEPKQQLLISTDKAPATNDSYENAKTLFTQKKYEDAFVEFKKLAVTGHVKACYMTGFCYYHALGIKTDPERAFKYVKFAVDNKHVAAIYLMGIFLYKGFGCTQDLKIAKQYIQKAASLGHEEAKVTLQKYKW